LPLSRPQERLLRRLRTRKGREGEGVVLIEGFRAIETAAAGGGELLLLLSSANAPPAEVAALRGALLAGRGGVPVEWVELEEAEFREVAMTETPQGVLCLAREPRHLLPDPSAAHAERILVLDGVQDPGNVGTLLRACAAFGATRIVALDGTVDPWSPKVVRGSAGLVFHLPIHTLPWREFRPWLEAAGLPLLAADARGMDLRQMVGRPGTSASGTRVPEGWALVLGNEGRGPRPELLLAASQLLAIPLPSNVESLNVGVAGAIFLWALGPALESPVPYPIMELPS